MRIYRRNASDVHLSAARICASDSPRNAAAVAAELDKSVEELLALEKRFKSAQRKFKRAEEETGYSPDELMEALKEEHTCCLSDRLLSGSQGCKQGNNFGHLGHREAPLLLGVQDLCRVVGGSRCGGGHSSW